MRVYLAGPMRGLPNLNFPAFMEAAERLCLAGHRVMNPAAMDLVLGYGPATGEDPHALRHVMQVDIQCIYAAEAIALLPGWERSRGTAVELALALFLDLVVLDAVSLARIYPPLCPWVSAVLAERRGLAPLDKGDWGDVWRDLAPRYSN